MRRPRGREQLSESVNVEGPTWRLALMTGIAVPATASPRTATRTW